MKLSPAQEKDLETIRYFIPEGLLHIPITDNDIQMFFELSERGKHKEKLKSDRFEDGFNVLVQGKRWRGITIHELWREGILDGSVPYFTLLGGYEGTRRWYNPKRYFAGKFYHQPIPRSVVDFMKKEIFKGMDAELIEKTYQSLL